MLVISVFCLTSHCQIKCHSFNANNGYIMKLLSKTKDSQKQKSHQQMAMNILQKATPKHQRLSDSTTAKHQRLSDYVTPRFISLVVCMSVLLLGSCRKSPKAINPVATEGNLTIQLNCLGADLRADENDPMSAVEKLDLYFFRASLSQQSELWWLTAHLAKLK